MPRPAQSSGASVYWWLSVEQAARRRHAGQRSGETVAALVQRLNAAGAGAVTPRLVVAQGVSMGKPNRRTLWRSCSGVCWPKNTSVRFSGKTCIVFGRMGKSASSVQDRANLNRDIMQSDLVADDFPVSFRSVQATFSICAERSLTTLSEASNLCGLSVPYLAAGVCSSQYWTATR